MPSSFICPIPWISLSLGAKNTPRLCCHQDISLEKELTAIGSEISELAHTQRARAQMLKGEVPRECSSCHQLEKAGCSSPRLEYLERFSFDQHGTNAIKYLDLTPDNDCNLECIMCSPLYSQKLSSFYEKVFAQPPQKEWESKLSLKDIDSILPGLEMVTIAGGETLLSKKSLETIHHLAKSVRAGKIHLRLFTNLSHIPDGLLSDLKKFGSLQLIVSIDSVEENYELMRFPAKWEKLLKNLEQIKSAALPNLQLHVHTVITAVNWPYMGELLNFYQKLFDISPSIVPSFVEIDDRSLLHPRVLPDTQWEAGKKKLMEELKKLTPKNESQMSEIEQVKRLILKMESTSMSERFMDHKLFMEKIRAHRELRSSKP